MSTDTPRSSFRPTHRSLLIGLAVLVTVVLAVLLLQDAGGGNGLGLITKDASSSYLGVALLVFLDAVCPVFPGETTLNAASTLAAQGTFDLWLVILSGGIGAIAGDSALYWVARRFSGRLDDRVAHVKRNEKVAAALAFLGDNAPLLLTAGRFVPGVRFAVNATLGIEKYPYPRFLLWSAIGSTLWSAYTCALAYAVGTALANFPLASVIISGTITTLLLGIIFWKLKRDRRSAHEDRQISTP